MSTAAVSNSSLYQQLQTYFQQRRSDLQQLGQDLQSGDLSDAQTEYNSLQTLGQNGPFANGDVFYRTDREQDLNAVGTALQSGNLADAQQAFAQLASTFQGPTANSPVSPVDVPGSSGTGANPGGPEITLNLGSAPAGEQVTINLGAATNGTEQVTVSASNSQSQNPQQLTFNVNPNSNEQIVLNLFNNTLSQAQNNSGVSVSA
jgi:hypothetical protein